jgi:hypothetical protein
MRHIDIANMHLNLRLLQLAIKVERDVDLLAAIDGLTFKRKFVFCSKRPTKS